MSGIWEVPPAAAWAERLRHADPLVALFDFDGTLAPIVDAPGDARMDTVAQALLERLAACPQVACGIVSGRAADDLLARLPAPLAGRTYLSSDHGFWVQPPAGPWHNLWPGGMELGRDIVAFVKARLPSKVLYEPKAGGVAVHLRGLAEDVRSAAVAAVREASGHFSGAALVAGKEVLELRAAGGPDKGTAVSWILDHAAGSRDASALFVGDDTTDEDAFSYLSRSGRGLGIRVGPAQGATAAGAVIKGETEVPALLEWLLSLRTPA